MAKPNVPGYVLVSKIGSGTFADVYKAHKPQSPREYVAIKCILKGKLSTAIVESICTEIKLLKLLKHPHIVQMHDFCWDERYIYIVMEFCDCGDLSSFIKTRQHLQEKVCKAFLQQLASALEYLRSQNVSHMDLKPQNLLLTSKSIPKLKLTDFGLAQLLGNKDRESSLRGSPLYMAPEILLHHSYDASVDLWSTGVILYECLFGKAPYSSKSLEDLIEKIKNNTTIIIPTNVKLSKECRDLLGRLLQRDPKRRITFEDFFRHPFVDLASYKKQEIKAPPAVLRRSNSLTRSVTPPSPSSPSPGTSRRVGMTPFEELRSLANTTPSLKTALEIGMEGVQYDAEGSLTTAFERYEAALQQILPLLAKEPKGRRKELLHQQATLWMDRAEKLQERIKSHEALCADAVLHPDELSQCCLQ